MTKRQHMTVPVHYIKKLTEFLRRNYIAHKLGVTESALASWLSTGKTRPAYEIAARTIFIDEYRSRHDGAYPPDEEPEGVAPQGQPEPVVTVVPQDPQPDLLEPTAGGEGELITQVPAAPQPKQKVERPVTAYIVVAKGDSNAMLIETLGLQADLTVTKIDIPQVA